MDLLSVSDSELLRVYATARNEPAFAELVRRHAGLVYAAARRQLAGDHHRAEEATQRVFLEVAKQASGLASHPALLAWLHQRTRWAASHLRQAEARRRARETAAALDPAMQTDLDDTPPDWDLLAPLLDEAVAGLGETDRAAILLRHFERRSFAEVGRALRMSEAAAQMRTARALEKLRRALEGKGLRSGAAGLAAALAAQGAPPAPATVELAVMGSVAGSSALGVASGGAGLGFFTMQILKISALVVASAALFGGYYWLRPVPPAPGGPELRASANTAASAPLVQLRPSATVPEPDKWIEDFRRLFGLSRDELRARLGAMGFALSDRALERVLEHAEEEPFVEALLRQLALFHPDRLLEHAIAKGGDTASITALWSLIQQAWRKTRLEAWVPGDSTIARMRTAFAADKEFVAELSGLSRPYGGARDMDPILQGNALLALPPEKRRDGADHPRAWLAAGAGAGDGRLGQSQSAGQGTGGLFLPPGLSRLHQREPRSGARFVRGARRSRSARDRLTFRRRDARPA